MKIEYYTTVETSDEFWQQLIADKLNSENPIGFIGEEAGFTITTNHVPAIREMIELSEEYPEEIFEVTITTNDLYNNVIEYLEFRSGATFINYIDPIYHFVLTDDVRQNVDPKTISDFKDEIAEALGRIMDLEPSYEKIIPTTNQRKERISNISLEYGIKQVVLTARVKGTTYIDIDLVSHVPFGDPDQTC